MEKPVFTPVKAKRYIEKFFELRPVFLEDAYEHKVNEGNIIEWLKDHAPDYEELSEEIGFDSVKEEIAFTKEIARLIRDEDTIKYLVEYKILKDRKELTTVLQTLRRRSGLTDEAKRNIIGLLGQMINNFASRGKINVPLGSMHGHQIADEFIKYGHSPEDIPDDDIDPDFIED